MIGAVLERESIPRNWGTKYISDGDTMANQAFVE